MLEQKRAANRRYRKRKDIDVINDNDDAIAKLIADMRQAARDDRYVAKYQFNSTINGYISELYNSINSPFERESRWCSNTNGE